MPRIELRDWQDAREQASAIRFAVFVREQRVPAEIELDEHDAQSIHAIAFEGSEAIGTGRLLPDGHVGRMAVVKSWRSRGVGSLLLRELIEAARRRGDGRVVLSAQVHAVAFYRRHGFEAEGPVYEEAGIPHQAMARTL